MFIHPFTGAAYPGNGASVPEQEPVVRRHCRSGNRCFVSDSPHHALFYRLSGSGVFCFFKKKKGAALALFLVIGFCAVWGPWTLRNIVVKPRKSTPAVQTIHKGMYPNLTYNNDSRTYGIPNHFDPTWDQLRDMKSVVQEIIRRFKKEPLRYIRWYIFGKPAMFFSWNMIVGMGDVFIYPVFTSPYHHSNGIFGLTHRLMKSLHGSLCVLALITSLFLWLPVAGKMLPENDLLVARFISLLIFYFILVHIAGTPLPRYSVPLRPFVYGLAMLGIRLAVKEGPQYFQKNGQST